MKSSYALFSSSVKFEKDIQGDNFIAEELLNMTAAFLAASCGGRDSGTCLTTNSGNDSLSLQVFILFLTFMKPLEYLEMILAKFMTRGCV